MIILILLDLVANRLDGIRRDEDAGFSTAELLGNAALAIVAIAAIWGAMQTLGLDVVDWIRAQIIT